jgi:hypothetical protein
MKKLHFEILIHASPEKVWNAVVTDRDYREWASAFGPTSYFEGGWEKGQAIRFLGINEHGKKDGMISEIAESKKPAFISIRHLGVIMDGVEDTTSDAAKKWTPAYENYTLTPAGKNTTFSVDVDVNEEYVQMFSDMWPTALAQLKKISERNHG